MEAKFDCERLQDNRVNGERRCRAGKSGCLLKSLGVVLFDFLHFISFYDSHLVLVDDDASVLQSRTP
jgi:hypothetical protein